VTQSVKNKMNLQGKVALVTGATRGLGRGIAIGLGEAGATVYITGRTLENSESSEVGGSLEETQQAVEAVGGICIPVRVDHADDKQIAELCDRIAEERDGQLDLLVNNVFAGVTALKEAYGKPFWELEPTLWDLVNGVGLRSHYLTSVYAARMMTKRQQGLICTLSSWGGMSYIFGAAYGVGKSACDRLAAELAVELRSNNVASISVWPGIVGTEHIKSFAAESEVGSVLGDGYNWETPLLTGRVIAALAAEPEIMKYTGKVGIIAEIARQYRLVDRDGNLPVSLRSLKFILPFAVPALRKYIWWIPDFKIPWFILLSRVLQSPKFFN
jgi:NAD(P)-dependent dehydrogenase (short-subunit alcohol dehydrogenase family)